MFHRLSSAANAPSTSVKFLLYEKREIGERCIGIMFSSALLPFATFILN
jgi:hypothetical protein